MSLHYKSPSSFKMALEQRLNNESERSGQTVERLRQLLVFDRFLARVFAVLDDSVMLKGGLVLELRIERARATKDIDLRVMGRPEDTLKGLQSATRLELGDYLSYELGPDPAHPLITAEGLQYEGRRYRAEARMGGKLYGAPFGVDVAFAEPLVGRPELIVGSQMLRFLGIAPATYRVYPVETHLAEKFHAYTLPRIHPNSRVKDLPDIALLATVGPLEAIQLRAALDTTFQHRNTHPLPSSFPAPPSSWVPVYERMARMDGLRWRTLAQLSDAVTAFLSPILSGASGQWDPKQWCWTSASDSG